MDQELLSRALAALPDVIPIVISDEATTYVSREEVRQALADLVTKNEELLEEARALRSINSTLKEKSTKDSLTNLYNHRYILDAIEEEIRRAKFYKNEISVMMLDIDDFKNINDHYGHQFGDEILIEVGAILQNCLRNVDLVGRCGGDEFLILLPGTNSDDAYHVAERIRRDIERARFGNNEIQITVSIGIGNSLEKDTFSIIKIADERLYKAKSSGKNQIEK